MKITTLSAIILISIIFVFCKEETPNQPKTELYSFSGSVYSLVDSQKVFMEGIKVFFRSDSTYTDKDGAFLFEDVPAGEYSVSFEFVSASDSLQNATLDIIIDEENLFKEFFLFEQKGIVEVFNFSGKVYSIIDSKKVLKRGIKVLFLGDSTITDNNGIFKFEGIPSGNYDVMFEYKNESNSIITSIVNLTIDKEDVFSEFILKNNLISIAENHSYSGKVFSIQNGQKVYLENVKVSIKGQSVYTDNLGFFFFDNIPVGKHEVKFLYNSAEKTINKSEIIAVRKQDVFQECFLFEIKSPIYENLFPLAVGNIWVYMLDDLSKEYWKIIGTEIRNNQNFYKIEIKNSLNTNVIYKYYRIDQNTGDLYNDSKLLTNLSYEDGKYEVKGADGNTYLWIDVTSYSTDVLGANKVVKNHYVNTQEMYNNYKFVKEIGLIQQSGATDLNGGTYDKKLLGAIIDNVQYGDTSSSLIYDTDVYFYPLKVGYKWYYEYNYYIEGSDTIRNTRLKREVISEETMSNGVKYFKIENTFQDTLASFYDWQRLDYKNAILYGFNTTNSKQYVIEDYKTQEFDETDSYMPSILKHHIVELTIQYSGDIKSYSGWNNGATSFSIGKYNFKKYLGITDVLLTYSRDTGTYIEKINLIGSEIDGSISGIIW